jgi:hypothetical protein
MSAIVAYRRFLSRQPNNHSWKRFKENEAAGKACRGRAENSNAAIDRRSIHSGIIAAMNPATVEFSLLKIGARRPVAGPRRYPGVNPKARWKRLA